MLSSSIIKSFIIHPKYLSQASDFVSWGIYTFFQLFFLLHHHHRPSQQHDGVVLMKKDHFFLFSILFFFLNFLLLVSWLSKYKIPTLKPTLTSSSCCSSLENYCDDINWEFIFKRWAQHQSRQSEMKTTVLI